MPQMVRQLQTPANGKQSYQRWLWPYILSACFCTNETIRKISLRLPPDEKCFFDDRFILKFNHHLGQ